VEKGIDVAVAVDLMRLAFGRQYRHFAHYYDPAERARAEAGRSLGA
jgi:hypothetical protein